MLEKIKPDKQPNKFVLRRQEFTLLEKRLIYVIINRLQSEMGMTIEHDLFNNREFSIPFKILGFFNYTQIAKAAKNLMNRKIWPVYNDDEIHGFVPFPEVHYVKKKGVIKIVVYEKMVPYLLELREGYTRYQLKSALSLTSVIAQRFYELLSRFKDTGIWRGVEILYLKKLLNIEGKYEKFSAFRAYVIEASQKELKNKTDILFTYKLQKTGHQYTHISFKIYQNEQGDFFHQIDEQLSDDKTKRCLKYLQEFGITNKAIQNKIINKKQDAFWTWLYNYRQNKSTIHNPAGHLVKILNCG